MANQSKTMNEQLHTLRRQVQSSFIPYLVPAVYSWEAMQRLASESQNGNHSLASRGLSTRLMWGQSGIDLDTRISSELSRVLRNEQDIEYQNLAILDNMSEKAAYTVWVYVDGSRKGRT